MSVIDREGTDLISRIRSVFASRGSSAEVARFATFAEHFLRRMPAEELASRSAEDWTSMLRDLYRFVAQRMPNERKIRIFNPVVGEAGWDSTHTVIQVVTNDMPFVVDSTSIAIAAEDVSIHLVIHPVFIMERDPSGHLMDLAPLGREGAGGGKSESVTHFEIDRQTEPHVFRALRERILAALLDVERAVHDWKPMHAKALSVEQELASAHCCYEQDAVDEAREFIRWLADDHFTFLGYRQYQVERRAEGGSLVHVPGSGLGLLGGDGERAPTETPMPSTVAKEIASSAPLVVTKTNARATVHRASYMDYVGAMIFDKQGNLSGEHRFLGLFTSAAYNRRPWNIPYVRRKVDAVMEKAGFVAESHGGKTMLHILETLPRDELFQATADELYQLALGIFQLQERRRTKLFIRRDRFRRYFSCLVFIPRDRFNTELRKRVQTLLTRALGGEQVDFAVQLSDSPLARLYVVIRVPSADAAEYDVAEIEARLVEIVRSWTDRLRDILLDRHGEERGIRWSNTIGASFPAAYIEDVTPTVAAFDVEQLAQLQNEDDLRLSLYRPRRSERGHFRFKVFKLGEPIPLSEVLPWLENMGLRILSERPYRLHTAHGLAPWIQDFDMELGRDGDLDLEWVKEDFQTAFAKIAAGEVESDGFNRLILAANLNWREISLIRAYCKYLLQTRAPYSQSYIERTVSLHPLVAYLLCELFAARFDPSRDDWSKAAQEARRRHMAAIAKVTLDGVEDERLHELLEAQGDALRKDREAQTAACAASLQHVIEGVRSLDEDRILRSFWETIEATIRTNYFQRGADGEFKSYISLKLDSSKVPDLPKPRPAKEIFVYSPRVEGVHLRGGDVARGGLRWSDRLEDFRTEVLGLMKAQTVKNTLIVPVGAKGGFVAKHLPVDGSRDEVTAEVVACYRSFISGLLDLTDNLVDGEVRHPPRTMRYDDDDSYLVVAADKGTAAFSDIANSVAADYNFWLGDAFASGGSVGYDHKKMGITARGAWESVRRHFRELGTNIQAEAFTVVGIGDMSGDVFGNGMLLSEHICLVAAFNHQHIFLDPNPDPQRSFAERKRMFELGRSSWTDYDTRLISKGGGVFSRQEKKIPLSEPVRARLDIEDEALTPVELIRVILRAPVDLLWNGGIGTYVKARSENDADVGDRSNDALRVNGSELRCKVVGEGGNLGLTQLGRIEYALSGGKINTDFIDNSAGVDCSDHEVNLKILLDQMVADEQMDASERNALLFDMTDSVARLVLRDNYLQAQAISLMESFAVSRLGSKAHFIDVLESQKILDRKLEHLPDAEVLAERRAQNLGLVRPELAILLSYSKILLYQQLLASKVPEDPFLGGELIRYFPEAVRTERFHPYMRSHRLRREIIATVVGNSMVNRMGATFAMRMEEDTGADPSLIAKAFATVREIFNARTWWQEIEGLDFRVDAEHQLEAHLAIWNLLRHSTRWILHEFRRELDIASLVDRFQGDVAKLLAAGGDIARAHERKRFDRQKSSYLQAGFDEELATVLAAIPSLHPALDLVDVAQRVDRQVTAISELYYRLARTLRLDWLMRQIENLPVDGQWHAHARGGLRDRVYRSHRLLAAKVVKQTADDEPQQQIANWIDWNSWNCSHFQSVIGDMKAGSEMDYATTLVAVNALEQLVESTA